MEQVDRSVIRAGIERLPLLARVAFAAACGRRALARLESEDLQASLAAILVAEQVSIGVEVAVKSIDDASSRINRRGLTGSIAFSVARAAYAAVRATDDKTYIYASFRNAEDAASALVLSSDDPEFSLQQQDINSLLLALQDSPPSAPVPASWFLQKELRSLQLVQNAQLNPTGNDLTLPSALNKRIRDQLEVKKIASPEFDTPSLAAGPASRPHYQATKRFRAFLHGFCSILNIFFPPRLYTRRPARYAVARAWNNTTQDFKTALRSIPPRN